MKIALITDIHEHNLTLENILRQAEMKGCDEVACLGDIVGLDTRFHHKPAQRSARRSLELIRTHCRWVVAGNHDLYAAKRIPQHANGFEFPATWFEMSAQERKKVSRGKVWTFEHEVDNDLDDQDIAYIHSLPEFLVLNENGQKLLFSHYLYPDFTGSTTQYMERHHHLQDLWQFMTQQGLLYAFCGHAHTSFPEFAFPGRRSIFKAIHPIPSESIFLDNKTAAILLPPVSGSAGKAGFSILDTQNRHLHIVYTSS
ncbi:MAG TPA: metallophosphoesterase family protein [Bacteroidales bacterium]|nr:metallophosphoesterase family protein [Bacteroidales bacterium]